MKRGLIIILLLTGGGLARAAGPEPVFDRYFTPATLRIDLYHTGDARAETFTLDRIYRQGPWAGNPRHLLDDFDNGAYYARVYDGTDGRLIFSRGADGLFFEYATTTPAREGVARTFQESVLIPLPRNPVRLVIEKRDRRDNHLAPVFELKINPRDPDISDEPPDTRNVTLMEVQHTGTPATRCDIAVLAEGYSEADRDKFRRDLERFTGYLFAYEPFKSNRDRFNVTGVFTPSAQDGVDEPRQGKYRTTALGASFNALGLERYLLTEDNRAVRDLAANVPYDVILILANSPRYGGGGIYNTYAIFTADSEWPDQVFIHEFGHSFAGLADEYYAGRVAYNDFYPPGVEPTEPNITALLDPAHLKWRAQLTPGTPVPTPWAKAAYERLGQEYAEARRDHQAELARRQAAGASPAAIKTFRQEWATRSAALRKQIDDTLHDPRWRGKIGAFEGAGYTSRGLYRPALICTMFQYSKDDKGFCAVCRTAIARMIDHYAD